jgi:hypothetical protein
MCSVVALYAGKGQGSEGDGFVDSVQQGDAVGVILDTTSFYAEQGGQVCVHYTLHTTYYYYTIVCSCSIPYHSRCQHGIAYNKQHVQCVVACLCSCRRSIVRFAYHIECV